MEFGAEFNEALSIVTEKLNGWLEKAIAMLPNFVVAVLIVIAFAFLAKFTKWAFTKFAKRRQHISANLISIGGTIVYLFVLIAGLFVALSVMNLDKTVTSILAGAGVIGIALGFAFQDTAANFISGVMIAFRKPFAKGDFIETNDYIGIIKAINLRSIIMETVHGLEVIIPNKVVYEDAITNYTSTHRRRVDVECGVSYAADLERVASIAKEAVKDLKSLDKNLEEPITLIFTEFGGSSINFTLRIWLKESTQFTYLDAKSEAIIKLKKAFDQNHITIPFPIRTLDFGIEGGEKLNQVLSIDAAGNLNSEPKDKNGQEQKVSSDKEN